MNELTSIDGDFALVIGVLVYVIKVLIETILRFIRPDPLERISKQLQELNNTWHVNQNKINDMHNWMSPNTDGLQTWKDQSIMHRVHTNIGKLFSVVNDRTEEIKDMIRTRT